MDLYYNENKVASLPISGGTTIGDLKQILSNWLVPQGVTNYTVRLFFNNGTELSAVVFQSNTYDAMNFAAQANLLNGGSVKVNTEAPKAPSPAKVPKAVSPLTSPTKVVGTGKTREELNTLKIPELKEILKGLGAKTSGNKQELIERILSGAPPKAGKAGRPPKSPKVSPKSPKLPKSPKVQNVMAQVPVMTQLPAMKLGVLETLAEMPAVPEGTIYVIKDDDDNYTGFTSKESALRWWLENELPNTDIDIDELGLSDPIDYEDPDEQELIEQAMEGEEYDIFEVQMME